MKKKQTTTQTTNNGVSVKNNVATKTINQPTMANAWAAPPAKRNFAGQHL